jgi:hypothetical protein
LLRVDAQAVADAEARQSEADHGNHETGDFRRQQRSKPAEQWRDGNLHEPANNRHAEHQR